MVLVALAPNAAAAATFNNTSPADGTVLSHYAPVTFSVGATATAGQTIAPTASITVDGGTPVTIGANYVVTEWVWDDGAYDYLP